MHYMSFHPGLLILLLIFPVSCSESDQTRMQRFLLQGNEMVENQNYREAVEYYKAALKIDSCFPDAWNNMGTVFHSQNDFSKAIESYSKAISCQPGYTDAYLNRANSYYEANELFAALKDLELVGKKLPDTLAVHFLRGLTLTKLRNYPLAGKAFKKALEISPDNRELQINLGTVYYYEKKYDSARYFLHAGEEKDHPNAYNTLALIETETGDLQLALKYINRALSDSPNDPYFLNNRGFIYLQMNDIEKALTDINGSISLDPYNGWTYRNKGIYYLRVQRPDDALRMFNRSESIDKYIQDLYYYMGEAHWMKGDKTRACSSYKISLENKEGKVIPPGRCSF